MKATRTIIACLMTTVMSACSLSKINDVVSSVSTVEVQKSRESADNDGEKETLRWFLLEDAIDRAVYTNKPVFVLYYASSCGTCIFLDKVILSDSAVIKYLNDNFVLVRFDLDDDLSRKAALTNGIKSVPTIDVVVLERKKTHEGTELVTHQVVRMLGATKTPSEMLKHLKDVKAKADETRRKERR